MKLLHYLVTCLLLTSFFTQHAMITCVTNKFDHFTKEYPCYTHPAVPLNIIGGAVLAKDVATLAITKRPEALLLALPIALLYKSTQTLARKNPPYRDKSPLISLNALFGLGLGWGACYNPTLKCLLLSLLFSYNSLKIADKYELVGD